MKVKASQIVSIVASSILLIGAGIGNYQCYIHEAEISSHLCPGEEIVDTSKVEETNAESDVVVQALTDEGIALLKNNGTLPLVMDANGNKKVNLFGLGSTDLGGNNDQNGGFFYSGTGSGGNWVRYGKYSNLQQGLESAGFQVNNNLLSAYKNNKDNFDASWYNSGNNVLNEAKNFSDTAIITISRTTGENQGKTELTEDISPVTYFDNPYHDRDADGRNPLQISLKEEAMINYVKENFEKVIILINSGNTMELGFADDAKIDALLYVSHPGQSGTKSIGSILAGKVNPSGHLVDTFPYDSKADPTWANVIYTDSNGKQITYAEDIYIGYKWYETADYEGYFKSQNKTYNQVVQYSFGHGLSYTDFDWSVEEINFIVDGITYPVSNGASFEDAETDVEIKVKVKNTGSVAGKEVVQLYYTPPYYKGEIEKAYVNLLTFGKTKILEPQESEVLSLKFKLYDMASYDCYDKNHNSITGWELDPGDYQIKFMKNAHEEKIAEPITLKVPNYGNATSKEGFDYFFDPHSSGIVFNRFTGEDAEYGIPIDGNSNGSTITYLSRADFENTFPKSAAPNRTSGANICNSKGYYGWDNAGIVAPRLNNTESKLTLYTKEDGTRASLADLEKTTQNKIIPNEDLIMALGKDYDDPQWVNLLSQLSIRDIDYIVSTAGYGTKAVESIGLPTLLVHDGPAGFQRDMVSGTGTTVYSTAFPDENLVAMTWNLDLVRQQGSALGREGLALGESGLYAPTVNLHRHAYNTRNFEAYSEDGRLSGMMGAAMIKGAQSHGICVSLKHFALSEAGQNPDLLNTWLTEQNLRENYLKAFEIAVKDGGANFIMSAFNNIGAIRCRFSNELLNGVLRDEWGFKGSVITDYDSEVGNSPSLIRAGNDLKLNPNNVMGGFSESNPGDVYYGVQAVKNWLYSHCNTYYLTKTYDPNMEFTVVHRTQPFKWWIPTLIGVDVLLVSLSALWITLTFVKAHKKKIQVNKEGL